MLWVVFLVDVRFEFGGVSHLTAFLISMGGCCALGLFPMYCGGDLRGWIALWCYVLWFSGFSRVLCVPFLQPAPRSRRGKFLFREHSIFLLAIHTLG